METQIQYRPPLALEIISAIFLGSFALVAAWIALDIIRRKGWRTMMAIMIPVYVLNASYLAPLTLWTYLKYGRPSKPVPSKPQASCHDTRDDRESRGNDFEKDRQTETRRHGHHPEHKVANEANETQTEPGHHACHTSSERPLFATVTVGVCHCGAGCLLGDLVGEWLVYTTGAKIHGQSIWAEWLIDYAFALLFGIFFQYFSIAPMSGDYSVKTIVRAMKADILSLTSFEIGLFGWMAIFQIGIFRWQLEMNTATYWWMMQIGMVLGHWTAVPMNYWLIAKKIKEPCA